ncbi:hypothetical protein ATANTOWER_010745 [Ataeniobius toweri]|uniref:Uncharacterized protein n=1 Tax=Ataeniobius toweri TaxID=208326 RepID=A0ABU7ABC2_9TELE|nr:hypothetical protein [Ataeniobius toweri]
MQHLDQADKGGRVDYMHSLLSTNRSTTVCPPHNERTPNKPDIIHNLCRLFNTPFIFRPDKNLTFTFHNSKDVTAIHNCFQPVCVGPSPQTCRPRGQRLFWPGCSLLLYCSGRKPAGQYSD